MKSVPVESFDLDPYISILNAADRDFRIDVAYAVAVSKAARTISSKRALWKLRLELREASVAAQKLCAKKEPFDCLVEDPCGLGSCPFAKKDMAKLKVPRCSGSMKRPQISSKGDFSLDAAAEPLRLLREKD